MFFNRFKLFVPNVSYLFLNVIFFCVVLSAERSLSFALEQHSQFLPFSQNAACMFERPEFSRDDTPLNLLTLEAFKKNTLSCLSNASSPVEELTYINNFLAHLTSVLIDPPQTPSSLWKKSVQKLYNGQTVVFEMDYTALSKALSEIQPFVKTPKFLEWITLRTHLDDSSKKTQAYLEDLSEKTQDFTTEKIDSEIFSWDLVRHVLKQELLEGEIVDLFQPIWFDLLENPSKETYYGYYPFLGSVMGYPAHSSYLLYDLIGCNNFDRQWHYFDLRNQGLNWSRGGRGFAGKIIEIPTTSSELLLVTITGKHKKAIAIKPHTQALKALQYYLATTKLKNVKSYDFMDLQKLQRLEEALLLLEKDNKNRNAIKAYYQILTTTCHP
jgi:hypothetical protein